MSITGGCKGTELIVRNQEEIAVVQVAMRHSEVVEQILENPEGDEWKIVIAKGIAYDNAVNRAYIKGRNEQIEVIRKTTNVPLDDFERIQALKHRDSDFLANPRRSVWDI